MSPDDNAKIAFLELQGCSLYWNGRELWALVRSDGVHLFRGWDSTWTGCWGPDALIGYDKTSYNVYEANYPSWELIQKLLA